MVSGGYSQSMLGDTRSEVISSIKSNDHLRGLNEGFTKSGYPYITVLNRDDDMLQWIFDSGVVSEYIIIIDSDDLNGYIESLNKHYVREKSYQWSDYSSGTRIYWWIAASDKFYNVHCSYSNPNL